MRWAHPRRGTLARPAIAAAAILVGGMSCSSPVSPSVELTRFRTEPFAFLGDSGLTSAASVVVRDQNVWQALWSEMHSQVSPVPPVPAIDFSREMVVARAMGVRPTGGYNVVLTGASRIAGRLIVEAHESRPGPNCGVTLALTSPVDIGRLPATIGAVEFSISESVNACGP